MIPIVIYFNQMDFARNVHRDSTWISILNYVQRLAIVVLVGMLIMGTV